MITEAVCNWFLGIVAAVISWLPDLPPEASTAVGNFDGDLASIIEQVAKLSPLIPFSTIGAAAAVLGIFTAFALVLQVSRITLSVLTLGGGSV